GALIRFEMQLRDAAPIVGLSPSAVDSVTAEDDAEVVVRQIELREQLREQPRGQSPARTRLQLEKVENLAKLRVMLRSPKWRNAKRSAQASELGVDPRTLRNYLRELRAAERE